MDSVKDKFRITVTPVVTEVNEKEEVAERPISTPLPAPAPRPGVDVDTNVVTYRLEADWEMIANHALFQDELKDYFREFRPSVGRTKESLIILGQQLGGQVELRQNELIYTHLNNHSGVTKALVANKTNNFMQRFRIETLRNLNGTHLEILRANSRTAVWRRQQNRDYLVATKTDAMRVLKGKLFPRRNSPTGSKSGSQRSTRSVFFS